MIAGFSEALRGANGGYELNRVVGFVGGLAYVGTGCAIGFITKASVTEFCLAFPAGLAAVVTGASAAVSIKDKAVASAKVIEQTGAVPPPPPDGPQVPVEEKA